MILSSPWGGVSYLPMTSPQPFHIHKTCACYAGAPPEPAPSLFASRNSRAIADYWATPDMQPEIFALRVVFISAWQERKWKSWAPHFLLGLTF